MSALSVKLNNLVWTTENYNDTKLASDVDIAEVTDAAAWVATTSPAWCWYNNTADTDWRNKYKRLYNSRAIDAGLKTPTGWSLPSAAQYDALQVWLIANGYNWDGTTTGNKIAKAMASAGGEWDATGVVGVPGNAQTSNNTSGLAWLPGGIRLGADGSFVLAGTYVFIWSAASTARYNLVNTLAELQKAGASANSGMSVRLVRALVTPAITSVTRVGLAITITGTGFKPDAYAADPVVTENGSAITPLTVSDTEVTYQTVKRGTLTYVVTNSPDAIASGGVSITIPGRGGLNSMGLGLMIGMGLTT